jgi:hypothetical protein
MPPNYLSVGALYEYHRYYGENFKVESPTGSGRMATIREVADSLALRLARLSLKDRSGHYAVMATYPLLYNDPASAGRVLF